MGDNKITREELAELFGPQIPIDVVERLFTPQDGDTLESLRKWMFNYKQDVMGMAKLCADEMEELTCQ